MKRALLILGLIVSLWGVISLPFGQSGVPKRTADLFRFSGQGLFDSGGITLLGIGLFLIFFAALIPRRQDRK